jgi:hypothetical protein
MSAFTLIYTRALELPFYSDTVNIPFPNVVKTGTNTSVVANKLVDSTANFSGIQVGDTVYNSNDLILAYVVAVENNTTLLLSDDAFTSGGAAYTIYQGQNYGCYIYVPAASAGNIEVETIGGDIVTFFAPPGGVLPVQVFKIMSGTSINDLVALW